MKLRFVIFCLMISTVGFGQNKPLKISIQHLTKNFYICVSYGYPPNSDEAFPANSLFAVSNKGIVLINTPWGEEQTQQLVDSVKKRFNKKIIFCIGTHFHEDSVDGFNVLKMQGTKTYSSRQTYALAKKAKNKLPQFTFTNDTTFSIAGITLNTYYPGEGHTKDNIVVWLPQGNILFGGCLVKSLEANTKGFTGDANLKQWPTSIESIQRHFKNIRYVIPGHQGWQGGRRQLIHTIKIIGAAKK